jgi:hypothetical protein
MKALLIRVMAYSDSAVARALQTSEHQVIGLAPSL